MRVWRLARPVYAALDGEGARRHGGRWNSKGLPVIYTSGHLSLAVLELLAHVDPDEIPDDLRVFEIEVPDSLEISRVDVASLPPDWQLHEHQVCKHMGDDWLRSGGTPVLGVPSALVRGEVNYLINPRHRDASSVAVVATRPFVFDPRLLG